MTTPLPDKPQTLPLSALMARPTWQRWAIAALAAEAPRLSYAEAAAWYDAMPEAERATWDDHGTRALYAHRMLNDAWRSL